MEAMVAAEPALFRVRRVITRPSALGGEDYEGVSEAEFAARAKAGAFALHWRAHGMAYGIPVEVAERLQDGQDALANLSRSVLGLAAEVFDDVIVLNVSATPEVLAERLANRGRESAEEIARRLARQAAALPADMVIHHIDNSGALERSVAEALSLLYPVKV